MLSLVATCMNREAHLRRSLPTWLELPGVDEVVIVDWSSRDTFFDLLAVDPRVRIVRVEDEPQWVMPYAVNLAVAQARGNLVLKCDADCLPAPAVTALQPAAGHFLAGDWRSGRPLGKACVNGLCLFTKAQWEQVNGYSELVRRYGRDDVDFYDRLVAAGHARREIPAALIDFLPHDDAERVANYTGPDAAGDVEALLNRQLDFHETINVVVAAFLPWGPGYPQSHYTETAREAGGRLLRLRRDVAREIPLSAPLMQIARAHALRAVAARLGRLSPPEVARLDEAGCLRVVARHASVRTP